MNTHSFRQSLLALVVVGTLSPLALLDCASSNSGSGNPDGGVCPASAPTSGSLCFAAEATTCNYPGVPTPGVQSPGCYCCNGGGGPPSFVCSKGKWQEIPYATGGGAPSNAGQACPATIPTQGASCSSPYPCGGARPQQLCSYNCDTGHGRAGTATCANGSWNISELGLACPVDAGTDASDAAHDASAD